MTYPKIRPIKVETSGYLGDAVRITAIFNINIPTIARITIEDPSGIEKISQVNMTKEADKVYSYIYQSDDDDNGGEYSAIVEVSDGTNISMEKATFILEDVTLQWEIHH